MPRPDASDRVRRFLERHLRAARPGEALPSFRDLMEACRVGPTTVRRVLSKLEDGGMLQVVPLKGSFRHGEAGDSPSPDLPVNMVDVVYICGSEEGWIPPFHEDLIESLRTVGRRTARAVRCHILRGHAESATELRKLLNRKAIDACVLINVLHGEVFEPLVQEHVLYVALFPAGPTIPPNSLLIDPEEVVCKQVEHLMELGHVQIGYLHNIQNSHFHRDLVLRRETFYRLAVERPFNTRSSWVRYAGYDEKSRLAGARGLLSPEDRPTALICADDHLPAVYQVADELGLRIPQDLSIIATNDDPITRKLSPTASSVHIPRATAAQMAFDMLDRVASATSGMVPHGTIPLQLTRRDSTAPPGAC